VEAQPSPENDRKSRARERHERRKSRQQGMASPSPLRAAPRQLSPTGGFKMPEIRLPQNRFILYGLAAGAFILIVVLALGRLKNDSPATGSNAIWLGTEWTYRRPADEVVNTLVARLRDHGIGTIYAWVSLLQPNGAWSETIRINDVKAFVDQVKRAYPEASVYGWLSVAAEAEDGSDRLGNTQVQQTVADFSNRMVAELGFDGVFLNVVPVTDNDEDYLRLLRKVRATMGEDALLAVGVPPDWTPPDTDIPQPPQIAPGTVWAKDYKQRVAILADQIAVMAYNSGLSTTADYSAWMSYQVDSFAAAIAELDTGNDLLIGVPTYDTSTPDHDPAVENVEAAIAGIRAGLSRAGDAGRVVAGIAIYAEWETSAAEWDQVRSLWIGQ
jgi:hypothetical protein